MAGLARMVPPPLLVIVIPAKPTATHDELFAQLTPLRNCVVPEDSALHVVPLLVEMIVPRVPTATHVVALEQLTLLSVWSAPDRKLDSYVHVVPPLPVK